MKESSENKKLETVLEEIFQDDNTVVFDMDDNRVSANELETEISNSFSYDQEMKFRIQASEEKIGKNRKFFESFFENYIDKYGFINASSLIVNDGCISIDDFIARHVMNAVLYLKPRIVSKKLVDWKHNNSENIRVGCFLENVKVNKKLNSGKFSVEPIEMGSIGKNTAICYFNESVKPLLKPFENENFDIMKKYSEDIIIFRNCLTLICKNYIQIQKWWINDELIFFNPSFKPISIEHLETQRQVDLSKKHIDWVMKYSNNFKNLSKNSRFKTSFQRLRKSMKSYNDIEKTIDLRIAMDALFSPSIEGSYPSLMMRNNAARFVEEDSEKRFKLSNDIQPFYKDASIVIHGGELSTDGKPKKPRNIQVAQETCIKALIKMIEKNEIPDWDRFILE